jgi:hypothetical protein
MRTLFRIMSDNESSISSSTGTILLLIGLYYFCYCSALLSEESLGLAAETFSLDDLLCAASAGLLRVRDANASLEPA